MLYGISLTFSDRRFFTCNISRPFLRHIPARGEFSKSVSSTHERRRPSLRRARDSPSRCLKFKPKPPMNHILIDSTEASTAAVSLFSFCFTHTRAEARLRERKDDVDSRLASQRTSSRARREKSRAENEESALS